MRCIVTGGSSGIGRAMALEFAKAGMDVAIQFRQSRESAAEVGRLCEAAGVRFRSFQVDLSDVADLTQFARDAWDLWGGVDLWVNNAGVDLLTGGNADLPFEEKLQLLLDVDVRASVLLSKEIGKRMYAAESGSILNIGWDQADRGMEGDSGELFAAAKNAVMGFTRSLAVSLAPRVRVNCIAPGWIRTAWGEQASEAWQDRVRRETPLQRWGTPKDIAAVALFLASPAASYLTGQVINVNGGAVR